MRFVGIDPSTKTGFVALDNKGRVLKAKEITGVGDKDPKRMVTLIFDLMAHIQEGDIVCIEGFPFSTQRAMFAGGLHHGIRNELYKRGLKYYEVAPNAVKKFVGVTGWVGEPGQKRRLKDKEKKKAVLKAVEQMYGFTHSSDNIIDAYILAKIAWEVWMGQKGLRRLPVNQQEVINSILYPKRKAK
jgi:crossover junction endodeoxyribonuclease RuvC